MQPTVSQSFSNEKWLLEVRNLSVRKGNRWLLKDVSFNLKRREFVAIIGPNGAGKTKLLEAIMGDKPYSGQVLINGSDLYNDPENTLPNIGWLPSYNILHDDLTADQALEKIGQLRLQGATTAEIKQKADKLMVDLDFPERRRKALIGNGKISAGERKRLELCAELLNEPKAKLLILDEPTTNLDPDAELLLMEKLRDLSHSHGITVLIVTHTLQNLELCDRILFLAEGRIRADGKWDVVLRHMEQDLRITGLDRSVAQDSNYGGTSSSIGSANDFRRWAKVYKEVRKGNIKVDYQDTSAPLSKVRNVLRGTRAQFEYKPIQCVSDISRLRTQLFPLIKRNLLLFRNKPFSLLTFLLLGPFSGFLSLLILRDQAFIQDSDAAKFVAKYDPVSDTTDARQAMFVIALVITLLGLISSYLMIVKERKLYDYERVKGLSPLAYLLSKWFLLIGLVGIPAPTFLLTVLTAKIPGFYVQEIPNFGLVMITLYATCIAAITLGLGVSALSRSELTATGLLSALVIFYVFFSGGVNFNQNLTKILDRIATFSVSYWGVKGISRSIQLYCWASVPLDKDYCSLGHLLSAWLFLGTHILLVFALVYATLKMQIPWYSAGFRLRSVFGNLVLGIAAVALVATSWGSFLQQRSLEYFNLNASVTADLPNVNPLQEFNASLSSSFCPLPPPIPTAPPPQIALSQPAEEPMLPNVVSPILNDPGVDPTPTPTSGNVNPLPIEVVTASTELRYGPNNDPIFEDPLPVGTSVMILSKDETENWLRVKELSNNIIGWIPIQSTNLSPSFTGEIASPPECAKPVMLLKDVGTSSITWSSQVSGHVVAIIDLHRQETGSEFPPMNLLINKNDQVLESYPTPPTRQAFVFRGLSTGVTVDINDKLTFQLDNVTFESSRTVFLQVTIYFVPQGCDFRK